MGLSAINNPYVKLELDKDGYPVLTDREYELFFISASNNKTKSNITGVKRSGRGGNPWFDPSTGRFANMPPGVTVRSGGGLLKNLLNTSKLYIKNAVQQYGADQIDAVMGSNGTLQITLWRDGVKLRTFSVPTEDTPPEKANPGADLEDHNRAMASRPPGVDSVEWAKREDAIRAAAREFDDHKIEDVREWLKGRTKRDLTEHELDMFLQDVRAQRMNDLVDVLDHSIRRDLSYKSRGRRLVKLVAPRGWRRKTLANLDDNSVVELFRRLQSRGFSENQLQQQLIGRYSAERQEKLQSLLSDEPHPENSRRNDSRKEGQQRYRPGKVSGESRGTG